MNYFMLKHLRELEAKTMKNEPTTPMSEMKIIKNNFEDNHGIIFNGDNPNVRIIMGKDGVQEVQVEQKPVNQPSLSLLDQEVYKQIKNNSTPKYILLPVRGAIEAEKTLPFNGPEGMNARYGCNITPSAWSHWIKGSEGYAYDDSELRPYVKLFEEN